MVNKPKNIGTARETAVVKHARVSGFPDAERLALTGSADQGDIRLCRGVIIECKGGATAKAAGFGQITQWAAETERERVNAGADLGVLVVQRNNPTVPGPAGWQAALPLWAVVGLAAEVDPWAVDAWAWRERAPLSVRGTLWSSTVNDVLRLLRAAGYGEPLLADTVRLAVI